MSCSRMGSDDVPKSTGTKPTGSASSGRRSRDILTKAASKLVAEARSALPVRPRVGLVPLALCLVRSRNLDVKFGRYYAVKADRRAGADGFLRIVDESNEDYLYPAEHFEVYRLPPPVATALLGLSRG